MQRNIFEPAPARAGQHPREFFDPMSVKRPSWIPHALAVST